MCFRTAIWPWHKPMTSRTILLINSFMYCHYNPSTMYVCETIFIEFFNSLIWWQQGQIFVVNRIQFRDKQSVGMYLCYLLFLYDVLFNYPPGQHYYLTWWISVLWWTSLAFLNSLSRLNIKISMNYNNREQIMNTVHMESLQMTRLNFKIEYNAYCYICNW